MTKGRHPFLPNAKLKDWSQAWIKLCNRLQISYESDPEQIANEVVAAQYHRRQSLRVPATGAEQPFTVEIVSSSAPTVDTPVTAVRTSEEALVKDTP